VLQSNTQPDDVGCMLQECFHQRGTPASGVQMGHGGSKFHSHGQHVKMR